MTTKLDTISTSRPTKKPKLTVTEMINKYRIWICRWCGNTLSFINCNADGKAKDFCDLYCNQRMRYFLERLKGKSVPKVMAFKTRKYSDIKNRTCLNRIVFKDQDIESFVQKAWIEMLMRKPMEKVNKELILLCKSKMNLKAKARNNDKVNEPIMIKEKQ